MRARMCSAVACVASSTSRLGVYVVSATARRPSVPETALGARPAGRDTRCRVERTAHDRRRRSAGGRPSLASWRSSPIANGTSIRHAGTQQGWRVRVDVQRRRRMTRRERADHDDIGTLRRGRAEVHRVRCFGGRNDGAPVDRFHRRRAQSHADPPPVAYLAEPVGVAGVLTRSPLDGGTEWELPCDSGGVTGEASVPVSRRPLSMPRDIKKARHGYRAFITGSKPRVYGWPTFPHSPLSLWPEKALPAA
jgi:hypothetical protein